MYEYIPELGCYLKWLHGDQKRSVEKLYCMSAFHSFTKTDGYERYTDYNKYAEYLDVSISSIINNSIDWYVRLYIDDSILAPTNEESVLWHEKLVKLYLLDRVQVISVKMPRYYIAGANCHQGLLAVLFRYLPLFDANTSIMLFRDVDNIWTEQHDYLVNNWLENGEEELFLFLNQDYKRQQIESLTTTGVILENKFYTSMLSGLWGIRKRHGYRFPYSIWHKMFAYVESYTDFVDMPAYKQCKYYGVRFTYGFDELMLSRVMLPLLLDMGLSVYAIPIKIYDGDYIANLFDEPILRKFFKMLTRPENISIIRSITINNYWHMTTPNAGLSEYILCLLTNVYYRLITEKNRFYSNDTFINALKYRVYPVPLLMGIGLFTFKNYNKYNWFRTSDRRGGSDIVQQFLSTNVRLSIEELTATSDLSNNGDGTPEDMYRRA